MSQATPKFPSVPKEIQRTDPQLYSYLQRMNKSVRTNANDKVASFNATHEILLYSPARKIYRVVVDDAGVLTTELVQEP